MTTLPTEPNLPPQNVVRALRRSDLRSAEYDLLVIVRTASAGWSVNPATQTISASFEWMVILRLWTSIEPSRRNSLITLETASRVEAIMFANS